MNRLKFNIMIHSPKEKVWHTMLDQDTFRVWTAAFARGSYFEGSWDKGARIKFLTPEGEGMSSRIAENRPYEFISIEHLAFIKDGIEDKESPQVKASTPAYENYYFSEHNGATEVKVEMDSMPDFDEFMKTAWPKALARLKEICEQPK